MTREPIPLDDTGDEHVIETTPPPVSTSMREPSPDFIRRVCGLIGSGVSPYNASERWGVPRKKFQKWMRTRDGGACDALRAGVREARAVLRAALEIKTAKEHPERALRRLDVRDEQAEEGRRYSQSPRLYTNGSGHTLVNKALPHLVERVTDASIPVADLSPIEQAARVWLDDVIADLGGTENISATKMAVIRASVGSLILMSSIDHAIFQMASTDGLVSRRYRKAFPIVEQRMRIADSLVRQLQSVGLERAKSTPTDLTAYITEKYGTPASEPTAHEEDANDRTSS